MRRTLLSLLVVSRLTWALPALAEDRGPAPIPDAGTTRTTQPTEASETTTFFNRPLLVTGLLLFGGTYAASVAVGAESGRPADKPNLYIPVVGPWIDVGQRGCSSIHPCGGETGNRTLLALDGVTQGLGALAIVTSFFIPEDKSRHWFVVGSKDLRAAPATVGSGYGVAAVGSF